MNLSEIIKLRITEGMGYKLAYSLYGILCAKVGYSNIEDEIPEIPQFLNVINNISDLHTNEANEMMYDWITWILKYLPGQQLDFAADPNQLSEVYRHIEDGISDEEVEKYNIKQRQQIQNKIKYLKETNQPEYMRLKAKNKLESIMKQAKLLLSQDFTNATVQAALDSARQMFWSKDVTPEQLLEAADILQESLNPYPIQEMKHKKHRPFNLKKYLKRFRKFHHS